MTGPQANSYIKNNRHKVNLKYRLKFHAMPELGWMNDPNGLAFFNNQYHIFYQFHPYDSVWGPMHWGHMVSEDLIKFSYLPIALAPDQDDETGCFSGGAIVDVQNPSKMHVLYTKHFDKDGKIIEQQGLATTEDGIHFTKHHKPVIDKQLIEPYGMITDTRDPFPYYENGFYYVILGSKDHTNQGKFLIYRSKDLHQFTYHDAIVDKKLADSMAECPDLIQLGNKHVFLYSRIDFKATKHRNVSEYFLGTFNLTQKHYEYQSHGNIDSGHHFYAPQTLKDQKGRTIMIGWMEMWGDKVVTHDLGHSWQGALSFPRQLEVKNDQLYQFPIDEIKNYYRTTSAFKNQSFIEKTVDITINETSEPFYIRFHHETDESQFFEVRYDGQNVFVQGHTIKINPLELKTSKYTYTSVNLRIIVDISSFEIFVNDGVEAFTSRVYMDSMGYRVMMSSQLTGLVHVIDLGDDDHV